MQFITRNLRFFFVFKIFIMCSSVVYSDPFDSCPNEAFLIQDTIARIYGVNLATGRYDELSDSMGTSGKINAIGFNIYDSYIYGYGSEFGTIVKIGSDYTTTSLNISGLPSTSFYVGDVSLQDNSYYMLSLIHI